SQQGRPDGDQVLDLRIFLPHTVEVQPAFVIIDTGLGEDLVFLPAALASFTRLAMVIHRVGEETEGETGSGQHVGEVLPVVQILFGGLADVPGQCSDELISRVLQGSIRVPCVSEHGVSEDEQLVHTGTNVLHLGLEDTRHPRQWVTTCGHLVLVHGAKDPVHHWTELAASIPTETARTIRRGSLDRRIFHEKATRTHGHEHPARYVGPPEQGSIIVSSPPTGTTGVLVPWCCHQVRSLVRVFRLVPPTPGHPQSPQRVPVSP